MKDLTLKITGISAMESQSMIDAGMGVRYFLNVKGNYPRTDAKGEGKQCTVSIPEKTLAVHLMRTRVIKSRDLDEALVLMEEDESILKRFIGGTISGVSFQPKGTKYKLTARSREAQDDPSLIGEERVSPEARFILDYGSIFMESSERFETIEATARLKAKATNSIGNAFGGIFGAPTATTNEQETTTDTDESTGAPEDKLAAAIRLAEDNEIDISDYITKAGAIRATQTIEALEKFLDDKIAG